MKHKVIITYLHDKPTAVFPFLPAPLRTVGRCMAIQFDTTPVVLSVTDEDVEESLDLLTRRGGYHMPTQEYYDVVEGLFLMGYEFDPTFEMYDVKSARRARLMKYRESAGE